ncbi:MAG: ABC transporter ATP-binding protein [Chloroflexi bacterium]|nr:ABC transporter ATP-binding protein [Chloroflexota bacterium]
MALLEVIDLQQQFKDSYSLKSVNLNIEKGDVFALIGPTGAGKTTILRLIDLLDQPVSGRILFDGIDVTKSKSERLKARRRMAYVQQRPTVFSMNVYDNVSVGLKWRHVKRQSIKETVEQALHLVGLADHRKRDAKTLSGGETQRVAIARALVTKPELLLLDEPTANLDPISTEQTEEILENIIEARQTTMIMSTHDRSQGQRLANRMGVLIDGDILQVGTPAEIFRSPIRKRVADFVGVGNMLDGVIEARVDESLVTIQVNGNVLQAISDFDEGEKVWVLVRTEDVTFSLHKTSTSARNTFEGPIKRMTPVGTLVRIEIDCGFPLVGVVTAKTVAEMGLETGSHLFASFKATAVHVIHRRN